MPGRPGRKDHTLLRDEQLQESLLESEGNEDAPKKSRATVLRLLGLAKKEAWVRVPFTQRTHSCPLEVSLDILNDRCEMT